jgi:ArsR family transcriptional regulator
MTSRIVERLRAIADEVRIRILIRLKKGECNVTTLVEELKVGQASISKHLAVLRRAGIVTVRRGGNQSFYSIKDSSVFQVCHLICEGVKRQQVELNQALDGNVDFDI